MALTTPVINCKTNWKPANGEPDLWVAGGRGIEGAGSMATGCSREEPPFGFGVSLSLIECLSMSPA